MLFVMYKLQDVPDYAVLSELCYLLDGANLTRLLTYFAGKTLQIPTQEESANMSKAMLMYQYINLDGNSLTDAQAKLTDVTPKQKEKITELYLKIIPVMQEYNKNRPPEESRTFETRVKFINEIFSDTFTADQIMASCINYKLSKSFEAYVKDIHKRLWRLRNSDPMAILKRIDN